MPGAATCGMQMEYDIPDVASFIGAMLAAVNLTSSMDAHTDRSRPFPSFAARRNWNPAFRITTVVPMRILLLRPATHLHLTLMILRAEIHFAAQCLEFCC